MGRKPTLDSAKKPTIQVTAGAKNRFVVWLGSQRNPHQGQTVAAILDWFTAQPSLVQHVVLGQYAPEVKEQYAIALEQMARNLRESASDDPRYNRVTTLPRQHEPDEPSTPPHEPQSKQNRGVRPASPHPAK